MKKSPLKSKPVLSVIILNYNAQKYLNDCLKSISKSVLTDDIEVIVADNASTDDSFINIRDSVYSHPQIDFQYLQNGSNLGFSAGNNRAIIMANKYSRYIIFLNPDTTVEPDTFQGMIGYLDKHPDIAAATCYITLAITGKLQPESHRGFPTPLNTFWHFFGFGLPRLFPKSKFFNGYFMGHLDYTRPQPIDCCVGAFLMVRRSVGDTIGWWNEKYFMYGEDLDFCYQLYQHSFKLFFVPYWKITHYQGISSGLKRSDSQASRETRLRSARATVAAMRTFYRQNLLKNYSPILRPVIMLGIKLLEFIRTFKARYL
jgi:GT2 family glycosyltransferase